MRILALTHRLPYAPNRGDRIRTYHLLHAIAAVAEIDLVSLVHDDEEASHAPDLDALCHSVSLVRTHRVRNLILGAVRLGTWIPLTHSLLAAPAAPGLLRDLAARRRPDVIVASSTGVAHLALASSMKDIPLVLDMVDVDSEKWRGLADSAGVPLRWVYRREARVLAEFERTAALHAVRTLVVSEREREALLRIAPSAAVTTAPNGIDLAHFSPREAPGPSSAVVFTGVMNYAPNVDAVVWMAREVWPFVRQARPDATFVIVGASPASAVRRLSGSGIEVTGTVPDTRPYLWRAAVAVAPLRTGRGLQNKVLEAMAAGVPAVVTTAVAAGLPPSVQAAVDVADAPQPFAQRVIERLAESPIERRARAASAGLAALSWPAQLAGVGEIMQAAATRRPRS